MLHTSRTLAGPRAVTTSHGSPRQRFLLIGYQIAADADITTAESSDARPATTGAITESASAAAVAGPA